MSRDTAARPLHVLSSSKHGYSGKGLDFKAKHGPQHSHHTQDKLVHSTWSQSWFDPEMSNDVKECLQEGEKKLTWFLLAASLHRQHGWVNGSCN